MTEIRVASNIPYPPWEYYDPPTSKNPAGFDYDFSQALGKVIGVPVVQRRVDLDGVQVQAADPLADGVTVDPPPLVELRSRRRWRGWRRRAGLRALRSAPSPPPVQEVLPEGHGCA